MDTNPYAPAAPLEQQEIVLESTDRPIPFGGLVRGADVARLGYSRIGTVIATMLLIIGMLTCSFTALGLAMSLATSPASAGQIAASIGVLSMMVFFLVFPPLWLLSRFRGTAYARLLEKWSPRIVGPIDGKFEHETLELIYPHSRIVAPLQSLTGVRTSAEFVALTYDHRQMQVCVLPRHLFDDDDFRRVTQQLHSLATQLPLRPRTPISLDARLWEHDPLEMLSMPEDAIAFSGTLLFGDFTSTPVYREQMRTLYWFFAKLAVIALVATLLFATVFWEEKTFIYTFAGATLAVFAFAIASGAVSYLRHMPSPEQPVANVSGWLSQQGLVYNTAIGSSVFQHRAFQRIDFDAHSIQLILPGRFKQAVLLTERMFPTAEDFQQVRLWAGEHVSMESR